jgi:hypothetical protein
MKLRLERLFLHAWLGFISFAETKAFYNVRPVIEQSNVFRRRRGQEGDLFSEEKNFGEEDRRKKEKIDAEMDSIFDFSRRDFLGWTAATGGALGALYSRRSSNEPPSDVERNTPNNPPFSSFRRYKSIELSNGMQVLLVSDKVVRQSSACISIGGAGQFADPKDLNGMAHLMEHMTLSSNSGRRQNQKQQDFDEWLTLYDGASNGTCFILVHY